MTQAISSSSLQKQLPQLPNHSSVPVKEKAEFSRKGVKNDGAFVSYLPQAAQELATQQMTSAAVGKLVQKMQMTHSTYRAFKHNDQPAVMMRPPFTENYHLSFSGSQQRPSFMNRLLHPNSALQFRINGHTNEIVQTQGRKLSPGELVGALEAVNMTI